MQSANLVVLFVVVATIVLADPSENNDFDKANSLSTLPPTDPDQRNETRSLWATTEAKEERVSVRGLSFNLGNAQIRSIQEQAANGKALKHVTDSMKPKDGNFAAGEKAAITKTYDAEIERVVNQLMGRIERKIEKGHYVSDIMEKLETGTPSIPHGKKGFLHVYAKELRECYKSKLPRSSAPEALEEIESESGELAYRASEAIRKKEAEWLEKHDSEIHKNLVKWYHEKKSLDDVSNLLKNRYGEFPEWYIKHFRDMYERISTDEQAQAKFLSLVQSKNDAGPSSHGTRRKKALRKQSSVAAVSPEHMEIGENVYVLESGNGS